MFPYMTELVPKSIPVTNGKINLSNQEIVTKLKVNNLFLKIINFYTRLKIANQRISEGKTTCNVYVNWETQGNLKLERIEHLKIRYLLTIININTPFGRVLNLSAKYLQDLKFFNNFNMNGLTYKRKYT